MSIKTFVNPGPRPLIYNTNFNAVSITNILLVDKNVKQYQQFVDSVNSSTLAIVYSYSSQKSELFTLLQNNFTTINRIAFVFDFSTEKGKPFLDNKLLFETTETAPYSENVQFLINIVNQFGVKNVDYLACNTLNYSTWVNYFDLLNSQTGVIVGASNDNTGNIKYGGNWVLESTHQDVVGIYFTQAIEYYGFLLDNPPNLQYFTFKYTQNIIVVALVDVNNFYGVLFSAVPPWLYDVKIYYNNILIYTFSSISQIVWELIYNPSDIYDPGNYNTFNDSGVAFWTYDGNVTANYYDLISIADVYGNFINNASIYDFSNDQYIPPYTDPVLCFLEGTKILTFKDDKMTYVPIEKLATGDLIQTYKHGLVKLLKNGYLEIFHSKESNKKGKCLYRYSKGKIPSLYDDLVLTGCHSVLVKQFTDEQRAATKDLFGKVYITDGMARLAACLDSRAELLEKEGYYRVYHLALENDNEHKNYGVYANGMLTETTSISMFSKGGFTEVNTERVNVTEDDLLLSEIGHTVCEWI